MLKLDKNARFEKSGLIFKKYTFVFGKASLGGKAYFRLCSTPLSEQQYHQILGEQQSVPIPVTQPGGKRWWMFRNEFYWEDEGYSAQEVQALILERAARRKRRVERALAYLTESANVAPSPSREPIPDDVKMYVWQRDGGRCVKCGSQRNLEYDHIIPIAMGGSSTARNIQLLCESCNRSKGKSIV